MKYCLNSTEQNGCWEVGKGGGIFTRWRGRRPALRWTAVGFINYFSRIQKKKKTKPSGFVKRWRVSFRAVSEHSHSALNGSPVTSEKWTWGSIVTLCLLPNVPMNGPAEGAAGEGKGGGWRPQFKETFKVCAPRGNWRGSCLSLAYSLPFYWF